MLDPSTHLSRFDTNCGKIQYVSLVTLKTNRPSFCLILKLSHALDGLFSVYLGCMVVNIYALFAEWSITEYDVTAFRFCCLGFFLAWNPLRTFISIRITHNNTFWKCQKNWVFNISLIWQNLKSKRLFRANLKKKKKIKGPLFHCREISDHKYWWSGKTLSVLSRSILKTGGFFIKILTKVVWKLEKLK